MSFEHSGTFTIENAETNLVGSFHSGAVEYKRTTKVARTPFFLGQSPSRMAIRPTRESAENRLGAGRQPRHSQATTTRELELEEKAKELQEWADTLRRTCKRGSRGSRRMSARRQWSRTITDRRLTPTRLGLHGQQRTNRHEVSPLLNIRDTLNKVCQHPSSSTYARSPFNSIALSDPHRSSLFGTFTTLTTLLDSQTPTPPYILVCFLAFFSVIQSQFLHYNLPNPHGFSP
jgi:hypothetical protein